MKNETNIYDIDGNIIRKAGDNHKFTLEEVEKLVDDLTEKVRQNPDNQVYKVYLDNAHKYLFDMYNHMSTEEIKKRLSFIQDSVQEAKNEATDAEKEQLNAIGEAMEKLKEEYDKENENERHTEDICALHSGESETDPEGSPTGVQE